VTRRSKSKGSDAVCKTCGHVLAPPGHTTQPFTLHRQTVFLEAVAQGSSRRVARHLAGVSGDTIHRWLEDGKNETRSEAVAFRELYLEASAKGAHTLVKTLYETKDEQIALAVVKSTLPEFGFTGDLKREQMRIDNEARREDLRIKRARADLQEMAAEKAREAGKEGIRAFGLAVLLDDDGLSEGTRRELAQRFVSLGWIAVEAT